MSELEIRFWLMVLGHLFADFTLQGWLANAKQKAWWRKIVPNFEQSKYRYDYLMACVCHALYWAIIVCLPLYDSKHLSEFIVSNAVLHAWIDDSKANRHSINLITDQFLHGYQIAFTFFLYTMLK